MSTTISIKPSRDDLKRFAGIGTDRANLAAATVWAGLRILQEEKGPGHAALDLITCEMPEAYRKNWAKKLLGK
jgi:hypothetical protein